MHSRLTYSAHEPLTKSKKEFKNLKELNKASFRHDKTWGNFKDLIRRTASDKVSREPEFNTAKFSKYDVYQHGHASMVCKFFEK